MLVEYGEQVLDALERGRFDVVLLDRNMPGLGGVEALQAIRVMTGARRRLPVAILSADVTPEARREALDAGADAFLPKPIEVGRLLREVLTLAAPAEEVPARAQQTPAAPPRRAPAELGAVNLDTLRHLEDLGSSPDFLEKLVGVFVADGAGLLERIESAVAARNALEIRSLVHAIKGSSVSMGTERLTRACAGFESLSDAELRLQAPGLLRTLKEEFAASQAHLGRYLRDKQKSTG